MPTEAERAEIIEQLAKSRHGFGLEGAPGVDAHRRSPMCGDEFTVRVEVVDGVIASLRWAGHGCVVSTAAAAALATVAPGLTPERYLALAAQYIDAVQPDGIADPVPGDAEVFAGIGRYPLRAACATLAWRAALDALG